MNYSDNTIVKSKKQLQDIMSQSKLNLKDIINYSEYYKGKRYARFRESVRKVVYDEIASKQSVI
jgi:hypothetical protein